MKHLVLLSLLFIFACGPSSFTEIRLAPINGEALDDLAAENCIEVLEYRLAALSVEVESISYDKAAGNIKLLLATGTYNPDILGIIGRDYVFEIWPTFRFDDPPIATAFDSIRADSLGGYLMANTVFPYGTNSSLAYMDAAMREAEYLTYFEEFLSGDVTLLWGNEVGEVANADGIVIPAFPFYLIDLSWSSNVCPIYGNQIVETRLEQLDNGNFGVGVQLDEEGTRRLRVISRKMAQEQRQLALILNGVVIAAPQVQTSIEDGAVMISLDLGLEEADGLFSIIAMGEIQLELEVQSVQVLSN